MNKIKGIFFSALALLTFQTSAQNFEWAILNQGTNDNLLSAMCTDAKGYVYSTGYYRDTAYFGTSTTPVISSGSRDIYITKNNPDGSLNWLKTMGGAGFDEGRTIGVDTSGNVYVCGYFTGTIDIDPGATVLNFTAINSNYDMYLCKFDLNGNLVWAKHFNSVGGGYSAGQINAIQITDNGDIYMAGGLYGSFDLDPGANTTVMSTGTNMDFFVAKYNAQGDLVWAKKSAGKGLEIASKILSLTSEILVLGRYTDTTDFDLGAGSQVLPSKGSLDIFLLRLDQSGNYVSVQVFGGKGYDEVRGIAVDSAGSMYLCGYFSDTAYFNGSNTNGIVYSKGNEDGFLAKYDASSNMEWIVQVGDTATDYFSGVSINSKNQLAVVGVFQGIVDFNPAAALDTLSAMSYFETFTGVYDMSGNYVKMGQIGGSANAFATNIATNQSGDVFVAGTMPQGSIDCNPGQGVFNLSTTYGGSVFAYLVKLNDPAIVTQTNKNKNLKQVLIYPNPGKGIYAVELTDEIGEIVISNSLGQQVNSIMVEKNKTHCELDISTQPSGIYFMEMKKDGQVIYRTKVIKE